MNWLRGTASCSGWGLGAAFGHCESWEWLLGGLGGWRLFQRSSLDSRVESKQVWRSQGPCTAAAVPVAAGEAAAEAAVAAVAV